MQFQNKVDSLALPRVKYPTSGERTYIWNYLLWNLNFHEWYTYSFVVQNKLKSYSMYQNSFFFFLNDSIFSRYIPDAESAFKVADIYDSTSFDIIIQSYVNILGHAGVLMPFVIVCARSSYVVGRKNNITFITSSKLRSHLLPNKIWSFVRIRNIKKKDCEFVYLTTPDPHGQCTICKNATFKKESLLLCMWRKSK